MSNLVDCIILYLAIILFLNTSFFVNLKQYAVEEERNAEKLLMFVPRDASDGAVNNRRETFTFRHVIIFLFIKSNSLMFHPWK